MNFLEHYNSELRHLRESGARFAQEHPQVAAALGLHSEAVTDPFVERLLEGVAYLAARVQTRMDTECAEFAQQAIAAIAPLFQRATPAIATFAFHPDLTSPEAYRSKTIPRGTLVSATLPGHPHWVHFSTARDVTLWPLQLASAECSRSLLGLPAGLEHALSDGQGLVRLQFQVEGNTRLGELRRDAQGQPLHLSLAGDLPRAFALHRVLMAECSGCYAVLPGETRDDWLTLPMDSIRMAGLADAQALLPLDVGALPGLRLLREYFAQPSRFLGLELDVLPALAQRAKDARRFDLIFKLRRTPSELIGEVDASQFRLFATPVINLYPKRLDPVPYDARQTEQWLPVDRMRPRQHHLWAVTGVQVCQNDGVSYAAMAALDSPSTQPGPVAARYNHRSLAVEHQVASRPGGVDPLEREDRISLSLPQRSATLDKVATLLVKGLVADRGWRPSALLDARLQLGEARAVQRIECLWPASAPRATPSLDRCWEALPWIGAQPLSNLGRGATDVAAKLFNLMELASQPGDANDQQRMRGLSSAAVSPGYVRAGRQSPMAWVPSMRLVLNIASAHHADQGAWLFGRVLAHAVAEGVPLNEGLEVEIQLDGDRLSEHRNTMCPLGELT